MGPILLELGIDQRVMTASSGLMKLLTSSAATILFLINGVIQIDFSLFFMAIGFIAGFIGLYILKYITKITRRPSILTFVVVFVQTTSAVIMLINTVIHLVNDIQNNVYLGFESPCE